MKILDTKKTFTDTHEPTFSLPNTQRNIISLAYTHTHTPTHEHSLSLSDTLPLSPTNNQIANNMIALYAGFFLVNYSELFELILAVVMSRSMR